MLVRVQDLGDRPALVLRGLEALLVIQRIDGQRFAGFRAGDEVVEIAVAFAVQICLTITASSPVGWRGNDNAGRRTLATRNRHSMLVEAAVRCRGSLRPTNGEFRESRWRCVTFDRWFTWSTRSK